MPEGWPRNSGTRTCWLTRTHSCHFCPPAMPDVSKRIRHGPGHTGRHRSEPVRPRRRTIDILECWRAQPVCAHLAAVGPERLLISTTRGQLVQLRWVEAAPVLSILVDSSADTTTKGSTSLRMTAFRTKIDHLTRPGDVTSEDRTSIQAAAPTGLTLLP